MFWMRMAGIGLGGYGFGQALSNQSLKKRFFIIPSLIISYHL